LEYLKTCPNNIPIPIAMNNIKELDGIHIKGTINIQLQAIQEFNFLTPFLVYQKLFTQDDYDKLKSGESYRSIITKESFQNISDLRGERAYIKVATATLLNTLLPSEMGVKVARYLSLSDAANIVATNKEIRSAAIKERKKFPPEERTGIEYKVI